MIFVFHGPDDFTRAERVAELRARFNDPTLADLNVIMLEGRDTTLADIRQVADAMPFMADRRLVLVNGYINQLKTKEDVATLLKYLADVPPTTDLVFVEQKQLDRRNPVLAGIAEVNAEVVFFSGPTQNNLRSWIINRTGQHSATIEPGAAALLGRLVGSELRTLNSEIEKLALYTGGRRAINQADVQLLVPYVEEAESFGLANAIGQRNARKAYDQLHKLLEEGNHPMMILASIAAQIRGLLEIKDWAERGLTPPEIAERKGWRSDYAAKMRLREAANFSMARLEEILETLLAIDLDIKTGRIEGQLALDTLVARLCRGL
jgi:DNA polymerase-3 subunit delta